MDCYNDEIKRDIFKAPTTYQNEFKLYCDNKREFRNFKRDTKEPPSKSSRPYKTEDHETFSKRRDGIHVPFDLLLLPKPIINTNPYTTFQKVEPPGDPGKEECIKTRPRIYMTPAVSMDDVPDPEMRKLLIQYMYTTDWRNAEREATASFKKFVPDLHKVEIRDSVKLQVELEKPLDEKFQRMGKEWDNTQDRAFTDSTKEFWLHKDPPVICGACVDPLKFVVPEETKHEIACLISEEKLRFPHDIPSPSYAGYRTRLSRGVSLKQVDLPTVHPFLSTAQAATTRYAEDLKK